MSQLGLDIFNFDTFVIIYRVLGFTIQCFPFFGGTIKCFEGTRSHTKDVKPYYIQSNPHMSQEKP